MKGKCGHDWCRRDISRSSSSCLKTCSRLSLLRCHFHQDDFDHEKKKSFINVPLSYIGVFILRTKNIRSMNIIRKNFRTLCKLYRRWKEKTQLAPPGHVLFSANGKGNLRPLVTVVHIFSYSSNPFIGQLFQAHPTRQEHFDSLKNSLSIDTTCWVYYFQWKKAWAVKVGVLLTLWA